MRYLDKHNALEAMRHPEAFRRQEGVRQESVSGKIGLALAPFAVARVDLD